MQYNAMPCYTMQCHVSLITADGAYHCPVGSIMAIFIIIISQTNYYQFWEKGDKMSWMNTLTARNQIKMYFCKKSLFALTFCLKLGLIEIILCVYHFWFLKNPVQARIIQGMGITSSKPWRIIQSARKKNVKLACIWLAWSNKFVLQ